jgi:hypothetical protein
MEGWDACDVCPLHDTNSHPLYTTENVCAANTVSGRCVEKCWHNTRIWCYFHWKAHGADVKAYKTLPAPSDRAGAIALCEKWSEATVPPSVIIHLLKAVWNKSEAALIDVIRELYQLSRVLNACAVERELVQRKYFAFGTASAAAAAASHIHYFSTLYADARNVARVATMLQTHHDRVTAETQPCVQPPRPPPLRLSRKVKANAIRRRCIVASRKQDVDLANDAVQYTLRGGDEMLAYSRLSVDTLRIAAALTALVDAGNWLLLPMNSAMHVRMFGISHTSDFRAGDAPREDDIGYLCLLKRGTVYVHFWVPMRYMSSMDTDCNLMVSQVYTMLAGTTVNCVLIPMMVLNFGPLLRGGYWGHHCQFSVPGGCFASFESTSLAGITVPVSTSTPHDSWFAKAANMDSRRVPTGVPHIAVFLRAINFLGGFTPLWHGVLYAEKMLRVGKPSCETGIVSATIELSPKALITLRHLRPADGGTAYSSIVGRNTHKALRNLEIFKLPLGVFALGPSPNCQFMEVMSWYVIPALLSWEYLIASACPD